MWKCCAQMSSARSAKKKKPAATAKSSRGTKKPAAKKSAAAKKPATKKSTAKKTTKKSTSDGAAENATVAMCRQLAEIVESHALSELIIDTEALSLTMRRGEVAVTGMPMMTHMPAPAVSHAPLPAAAAVVPEVSAVDDSLHEVTSPFVGTFYRSPNPDSPPYCEVGQRVEKGQVLCIVEAMKLMNEIEADIAGTLEAVMVDNAEPVEYGQSLFKIKA